MSPDETPLAQASSLLACAADGTLDADDVLAYLESRDDREASTSLPRFFIGHCRAVSPALLEHVLGPEAPPTWVVRLAERSDLDETAEEKVGTWALARLGDGSAGQPGPPCVQVLEALARGERVWPKGLREEVVELLTSEAPSFRRDQRLRHVVEKEDVGFGADTLRRLLEARPDWRFLTLQIVERTDADLDAIRTALTSTSSLEVVRRASTRKVVLRDVACQRRLLRSRDPIVIARLLPELTPWQGRRVVAGVREETSRARGPIARQVQRLLRTSQWSSGDAFSSLLDALEGLADETRARIDPDVWIELLQAPDPKHHGRVLGMMEALPGDGWSAEVSSGAAPS